MNQSEINHEVNTADEYLTEAQRLSYGVQGIANMLTMGDEIIYRPEIAHVLEVVTKRIIEELDQSSAHMERLRRPAVKETA